MSHEIKKMKNILKEYAKYHYPHLDWDKIEREIEVKVKKEMDEKWKEYES
jgi:hypothetical protein